MLLKPNNTIRLPEEDRCGLLSTTSSKQRAVSTAEVFSTGVMPLISKRNILWVIVKFEKQLKLYKQIFDPKTAQRTFSKK
jgi:hypothetical protein